MTESYANVYALILAAGGSSRMGRPKQLLRWQGLSLLERSIQAACRVLPGRVIAVLGAHEQAIRAAVDLDAVETLRNPDWQNGIASSIRRGIEALPASAEAVLILLCDQPLVDAMHLKALLNAWQSEPDLIIASQYQLACGVPAVFPAAYFKRLGSLTGDKGAKMLLTEFEERVRKIPFAEAGLDIDTPGDFEQLTGGVMHDRLND
jgi:molybdenum cofactor cytidylyltransferase